MIVCQIFLYYDKGNVYDYIRAYMIPDIYLKSVL